jgi:hypothetical protein
VPNWSAGASTPRARTGRVFAKSSGSGSPTSGAKILAGTL